MLYALKGRFQGFAQKWALGGMTANHATLLGVIFVALTVFGFYMGFGSPQKSFWLLLTPLFIFLRLVMNALDGLLARAHNTASAAGEIMNELSDVGGDTLSYGILYFLFPEAQTEVVIFLLLIWLCEFVGVLGKSLPGGRRRQEALGGGKPERAVFMGLLALVGFFFNGVTQFIGGFLVVLSILILITTLYRIYKAILDARGKSYSSHTEFGR